MSNSLPYVGPLPASTANDAELATLSFVQGLVSQNMTQTQVNAQIAAALSSYSTKTQVDQASQTLGTMASVYQGAINAIQRSQIGSNSGTYPNTVQTWLREVPNYTAIANSATGAYPPFIKTWAQQQVAAGSSDPIALPALTGLVGLTKTSGGSPILPTSLLNVEVIDHQQYTTSVTVAPSARNTTSVLAGVYPPTEVYGPFLLAAQPTEPFYLLVWGTLDVSATTDGVFPIVEVTIGASENTAAQVLATGCGVAENYIGGIMSQYPQAGVLQGQYQVPDWAVQLDIITVGGGAAGEWGWLGPGSGGLGGKWNATTLSGSSLTPGMVLNFSCGAGGIPVTQAQAQLFQYAGGPGGTTTVTNSSGSTIVQSVGGTNVSSYPGTIVSVSQNGQPPVVGTQVNNATLPIAPFNFDGNNYYGAVNPSTGVSDVQSSPAGPGVSGTNGYAPGGGGEGGGASAPAGYGAPGGVWFFARPANATSSAGVTILPLSPANVGPITPNAHNELYVGIYAGNLPNNPVPRHNSVTVSPANSGVLSNLYVQLIPAGPSNV